MLGGRYCGTSRNQTCSDGFHQRNCETESRAYDWHISAPRRENRKVLVFCVCVCVCVCVFVCVCVCVVITSTSSGDGVGLVM